MSAVFLSEEYKQKRREERAAKLGRLTACRFVDRDGYINSNDRLTGKHVKLHRYFWEFYNGPIPEGMEVHHKNENKRCNCIANLELTTPLRHQTELHDKSKIVKDIWAKRSKEERDRITKPGRLATPSGALIVTPEIEEARKKHCEMMRTYRKYHNKENK